MRTYYTRSICICSIFVVLVCAWEIISTHHPRSGNDVIITCGITWPQAVLGDSIEVPTLNGKVSFKINPGTENGKIYRLRGKGLPMLHGHRNGDQLVQVQIETPAVIDKQEKNLIKELYQLYSKKKNIKIKKFIP